MVPRVIDSLYLISEPWSGNRQNPVVDQTKTGQNGSDMIWFGKKTKQKLTFSFLSFSATGDFCIQGSGRESKAHNSCPHISFYHVEFQMGPVVRLTREVTSKQETWILKWTLRVLHLWFGIFPEPKHVGTNFRLRISSVDELAGIRLNMYTAWLDKETSSMHVVMRFKHDNMLAICVYVPWFFVYLCCGVGKRNCLYFLLPPSHIPSLLTDWGLIYTSLCAESQSGVAAAY